MVKIIDKYKDLFISMFIVIGIGLIGFYLYFKLDNVEKTINNNNYTFKYDNSWKIIKRTNNNVILKHNNDGNITISIKSLDDDSKYLNIDSLNEDLIYNINKNNDDYNLIKKEKCKFTKNNYEGYKYLYENDKNNVLLLVYKKENKLVVMKYEASFKYFDILLDSANNIINSFDTKEEKYSLLKNIKIKSSKISFSDNKELNKKIDKLEEYEIASDNYHVKYMIPNIFKKVNINSKVGTYSYDNIIIYTNIFNRNIYEYLDKDNNLSIYNSYKSYVNKDNYNEQIEKKDKFYIYKNSYSLNNKILENVELIYSLDKNHIFTVKISGENISKKLVDWIRVSDFENYSSYIVNANNFIESYNGADNKNKLTIILNIKNYKEIDKNENIYENRYYVKDYDSYLNLYNYEVNYKLLKENINIEDEIKSLNKVYTTNYDYEYLIKEDVKKYNNKEFIIYKGYYKNYTGTLLSSIDRYEYIVNKKILFYKIDNRYLVIEINANNKEINEDIINEVTKFNVIKNKN